jgi:hypothetical protein
MSNDASLPPNAPIVQGSHNEPRTNGEEDASSASTSLEAVCADLHRRVSAFLDKPPDSDLTRRVQEQVEISIGVIEKALNDYECVYSSPFIQCRRAHP